MCKTCYTSTLSITVSLTAYPISLTFTQMYSRVNSWIVAYKPLFYAIIGLLLITVIYLLNRRRRNFER